MSNEEQDNKAAGELKPAKMPQDWNPDCFPTSAKPVFTSMGMLALIITVLCFLVYYTSFHPEDEANEERKENAENNFLAEEQVSEEKLDDVIGHSPVVAELPEDAEELDLQEPQRELQPDEQ